MIKLVRQRNDNEKVHNVYSCDKLLSKDTIIVLSWIYALGADIVGGKISGVPDLSIDRDCLLSMKFVNYKTLRDICLHYSFDCMKTVSIEIEYCGYRYILNFDFDVSEVDVIAHENKQKPIQQLFERIEWFCFEKEEKFSPNDVYVGEWSEPYADGDVCYDVITGSYALYRYVQGALDHDITYEGRCMVLPLKDMIKKSIANLTLLRKVIRFAGEPYDDILKDVISTDIEQNKHYLGKNIVQRNFAICEKKPFLGDADYYYKADDVIGKYENSCKTFFRYLPNELCWQRDDDLPLELIKAEKFKQYSKWGWKDFWSQCTKADEKASTEQVVHLDESQNIKANGTIKKYI